MPGLDFNYGSLKTTEIVWRECFLVESTRDVDQPTTFYRG